MRSVLFIATIALALLATAQDTRSPGDEHGHLRIPAQVMSYLGADWLERDDREAIEQPDRVIAAMRLQPGDKVADIGSGSGYFTRRLARAVLPGGTAYGVDIQPEMNAILAENCRKEGVTNVEIILGDPDDPKLPEGAIDWILLVDAYHEFQEPVAMLEKMRAALKPGGRVALVEYRLLGESAAHIKRDHRMSVEQVLREWEPAGFRLLKRHEFLPTQHLFIFEKTSD
ncbi:MAG: class I SAM-dependent methyltransferase [Candidatus Hydrogenedentes bacterium]|nr:class I SAM-dependent methyltransferase [Candidatus Hydrogenedentota bacterium]